MLTANRNDLQKFRNTAVHTKLQALYFIVTAGDLAIEE